MIDRRQFLSCAASGVGCTLLARGSIVGAAVAARSPERFPHFLSTPVSYLQVSLRDALWAPRQKTVREVSVPWATRHYDSAGGLDELRKDPSEYRAHTQAGDLEAMKFIEAMASVAGVQRDPALERLIDSWGARVIGGQAADGYSAFGYPFTADPERRWQAAWYSHEDYALGNYLEAAIAYREATGNTALYESALRAADNMAAAFLDSNRAYAPGHPEIEQALMRLYEVSGNERYLQLCGWLIAQRGQHAGRRSFGKYSQDHIPVRDQRTIEGHAVRAAFLFNGVTEYVGATGDAAYREAVLAIWNDLVENKLYLHGASGNKSAGNEGYPVKPGGLAPGDTYGESCAVFGNFQWAHSLFRLTGDARYLDVAERMLYNAFHASLSLHGNRYFYRNVSEVPEPTLRLEWHEVACCPPNIVKLFSKVGGFFYSTDAVGIFVKHYGASETRIPWGDGVRVVQKTDFPWSGDITLQIQPVRPTRLALRLRIPDWAKTYRASVNGKASSGRLERGWLTLDREWRDGDRVDLSLQMLVERVTMPARFAEYAGLVAFRRGPIVYCLEQQDTLAPYAYRRIPADAVFTAEHRADLLGGITVLHGVDEHGGPDGDVRAPIMLIPYGFWNNREPGWMRIWLPTAKPSMDAFPPDAPGEII